MALAFYPAVIEAAADGSYGVFFPDLPGCTSGGDTLQEAALNAEEALQAHVELSGEHGEAVPPPSDLGALAADPDVREAARVLVRVEMPGRAVRVNITLPEGLLAEADNYARRMGLTRSGLLAEAVRERMRRTSV
jgi:predicted RNase H-like HicB family nuclease